MAKLDQQEEKLQFDTATASTYIGALSEMFASMQADNGKPNPKAHDIVRDLIAEIVISPAEEDGVPVEVKGRLSALVSKHSKILGWW